MVLIMDDTGDRKVLLAVLGFGVGSFLLFRGFIEFRVRLG